MMNELNSYEWGVEYPTNGVKPNLPDDVLVHLKTSDGNWESLWDETNKVKNWNWSLTYYVAFKIIDPRYKPEEERDGDGLPPVGTVCEYYSNEMREWRKCTIATRWGNAFIIVDADDDACEIVHSHNLRPIQTEHERLRHELLEIIESSGNLSNGVLADAIIEAGWRPAGEKDHE